MIKYISILFISFVSLELVSQEEIQWVNWEEALEMSKNDDKKFFVDLYTNWCGWCKKLDKTTFRDPSVMAIIQDNYIPIKFNAEQKEDIEFRGEVYSFTKGGRRGYHQLAAEITRGRLSYPTLVFMDEEANLIQAIPGYQDACTLEKILSYFSGDFHKTTPWASYNRSYECGPKQAENKKPNHTKLVNQKKN